jgi:hypothetical protein
MLGSSTIVGFIPTTNADRSRKFFVETLGLAWFLPAARTPSGW